MNGLAASTSLVLRLHAQSGYGSLDGGVGNFQPR